MNKKTEKKKKPSETTMILDALHKCIFELDPFAAVTPEMSIQSENQKIIASAAVLIHHRMRAIESAIDRLTLAIDCLTSEVDEQGHEIDKSIENIVGILEV